MPMGDGTEEEEEKDTVKSAPDRAQAPGKAGAKEQPAEKAKDKDKKKK